MRCTFSAGSGWWTKSRPGIQAIPRLAQADSPLPARKSGIKKLRFGPTLGVGGAPHEPYLDALSVRSDVITSIKILSLPQRVGGGEGGGWTWGHVSSITILLE